MRIRTDEHIVEVNEVKYTPDYNGISNLILKFDDGSKEIFSGETRHIDKKLNELLKNGYLDLSTWGE